MNELKFQGFETSNSSILKKSETTKYPEIAKTMRTNALSKSNPKDYFAPKYTENEHFSQIPQL
jgi:hypothetical protein